MELDARFSRGSSYAHVGSRRIAVAIALFALLCCFYTAWPIWRGFFPLEIDQKEAWNAYHADAAFGANVLYPPLTGLVGNNYPPLWYYLTGAMSRLGFDAPYAGRVLSVLAVMLISWTIALCIRRFEACWSAAVLGGLLFLGLMVRYADWYVAMNDPNLLALAIMMCGLVWLLRRDPKRGAEGPFLVLVLGGFFKHSLLAIPATALVILAARNRRLAVRAALVSGCVAAAGLALLTAIYGRPFIDQIFIYPREISIERAFNSIGRLGSALPGILIWVIWAWHDRGSEAVRFTAMFLLFGFAVYVLEKVGAGTDVNAQFEFSVALAIGVGLAFDRARRMPLFWGLSIEARQLAVIGVLALGLIAAPGLEPYYLIASADYRAQFGRNTEIMQSEVRRISAIPDAIHCSNSLVCRAAGKPFTLDVFFVYEMGITGRMTDADLSTRIYARHTEYREIDPRANVSSLQRRLFYGRSRI